MENEDKRAEERETNSESEDERPLLAYFSHSYRREEKEINLFFWDILSQYGLYFTVDPEINKGKPMSISYLEWMMRRCVCFVAVIPRRKDSPFYDCSPYQVFENSLAIRAAKPRLIFVERGLNETIFGVRPGEVCSFRRREEWLKQDKSEFEKLAERLSQKVHIPTIEDLGLTKPVALLIDSTHGEAYTPNVINKIQSIICNQNYSCQLKNPANLERDFLFLHELEDCSVLISEVRLPYISPDILGLIHGRCIPTIHLCHLRQDESIDSAVASMHLSLYENKWVKQKSFGWPLIFSKYQIDDDMEPVIFWKDPDELSPKIAERLKKFREDRVELLSKPEARRYFLRIGRRQPGQVFISNAKIQNNLVEQLKVSLEEKAINFFHYKNKGAITIGTQAWLSEIIRQIDASDIFVALLDSHYIDSEWCNEELEEAMDLYDKGQIMIHAYVIEEGIDLQEKPLLKKLAEMQLEYIQLRMDYKEEELRLRIVENAIELLDTPGTLQQIIESKQHFQTGRSKFNPRNEETKKLQYNHIEGGKQTMIIELLTTATVTAGIKFLFDQLGKMTDRVNDEKLEKIKEKAETAKTEQDVIAIQKLITETIPDAQKVVSLEAFTAWVEDQIDQDFTELIEVSEITFNVLREKRKREDNLMKKDNIRDMERTLKTSIEEFKQKLRTGEITAKDKGLLYGTITRTLDFINK